jgi:hypothetical protein
MEVRIVEPRDDAPMIEIDPLRLRPGERQDLVVAPSRHDPPVADRRRRDFRPSRIERGDLSVIQNNIGFHRNLHFAPSQLFSLALYLTRESRELTRMDL